MTMNRRRFFSLAGAAGAASLPTSRAAAAEPAPAARGKSLSPRAASPGVRAERFARRADLIRQSLDVPGMSLAVLHKQAVILARGFGLVDVASGTSATETTPYPIASITKTFAAAVIMKLVDEGKLDLDEPISKHDPSSAQWCASLKSVSESPAKSHSSAAERITLRHLLSHTSQGTPGTSFEYSSVLFAHLTAVINAVSPRDYVRSVEQDILDPLSMRDTALGAKDASKQAVIARMAKPYRLDPDGKLEETGIGTRSFDHINTASGIISTVMDLAKYDIGIDRDAVYSPQAKQQIWTATASPTGQKFPYGLGWFVQGEPGSKRQMVWHYGQYPTAFSSLLFKLPNRELTLILLACSERASSVFALGNGDPVRSAFVTAFLDEFARL
jgi:CubicO group peptidase (beta-lactamase class C family)